MSQETDLKAIRETLNKATLTAEVRSDALSYLDKLPRLYQELATTYESRFLDEILQHVKAMLRKIELPQVVESVTLRFGAMHERHGIPALSLKLPVVAVKKTRPAKLGAPSPARPARRTTKTA